MTSDNFIVFTVAGTSYALRTRDVAHVEMVEEITRVPNSAHFVDGVVFSRGKVVPALNLRARFGFDKAPYDLRTRLLVVQSDSRSVGLVVDSAREFLSIPAAAIQPPNHALTGLSGRYVQGIANLDDRLVLILDLPEVLNFSEPVPGADAASARR
jgi:purine-binding chemotaxis protein CheW